MIRAKDITTSSEAKRPRFRLTSPTPKQIERAIRPKEIQIHCAYVAWCGRMRNQIPELKRGFHPANGEYRDDITAKKLERMGVRAGVLDYFFPVARGGFFGLWIEFKRPLEEASDLQKLEIQQLLSDGYFASVFDDWEDATKITAAYMAGRIKRDAR